MDGIPDVFRNSYQVFLKGCVSSFSHIVVGSVAVLALSFWTVFTFHSEGLFRQGLAVLVVCCCVGLVAEGLLSGRVPCEPALTVRWGGIRWVKCSCPVSDLTG